MTRGLCRVREYVFAGVLVLRPFIANLIGRRTPDSFSKYESPVGEKRTSAKNNREAAGVDRQRAIWPSRSNTTPFHGFRLHSQQISMRSLNLTACLLALARSQNVSKLESDEPATNSTLLPMTTKAISLADAVICKIDENLHEGTLYNGSLFNCTHARGCLMNEDQRLEAENTVLLCVDQLDGRTHKCMFEWYVHWRECVGFNCYGIALDCEYQKRTVTKNVESPPTSTSSQRTLNPVLMLAFGIAVLLLSLVVFCYLYHFRHSGMVDFGKRERLFAARMAKSHTTADPIMFCTISAYDTPFVIATHE